MPVWITLYLKPAAAALTLIIAIISILTDFKREDKSSADKPPRQVLTRGGWVALILVCISGLFAFTAETAEQVAKLHEAQQKAEAEKKQAKLQADALKTQLEQAIAAENRYKEERKSLQALDRSLTANVDSSKSIYNATSEINRQQGDLLNQGKDNSRRITATSNTLKQSVGTQEQTLYQINRVLNPFSPIGLSIDSEYSFTLDSKYPGPKAPWKATASYLNGENFKQWLADVRRLASDAKSDRSSRYASIGMAWITKDPASNKILSVENIRDDSPFYPSKDDLNTSELRSINYMVTLHSKGRSLKALPSRQFSCAGGSMLSLNIDFVKGIIIKRMICSRCTEHDSTRTDLSSIYDLPNAVVNLIGVNSTSELKRFQINYGEGSVHSLDIKPTGFPPPSIKSPLPLTKELRDADLEGLKIPGLETAKRSTKSKMHSNNSHTGRNKRANYLAGN